MARPLSCHFLGQLTKEPLDGLEFVNMEMNRTHNFEAFESSSSSFNSIPPLGLVKWKLRCHQCAVTTYIRLVFIGDPSSSELTTITTDSIW